MRRPLSVALLALALMALAAACGGKSEGETAASTDTTNASSSTSDDGTGENEGGDLPAPDPDYHPVAGDFEPNDNTVEECVQDDPDYYTCLEQGYGNLAFKTGGKPTMKRFAADIAASEAVERGCHRIAHTIGSATLTRHEDDVGQAFADGDSTCWSGFYHGILERALKGATEEAVLVARLRDLCAGVLDGPDRFIAYQCVHGLGHGLMIRSGLDLPYSLEMCTRLETDWEQISCDGGVFMENFNTSYGVKSRFLKDDDPIYPCTSVKERHKLYCYLQITDNILALNGYDFPAASVTCLDSEPDWISTCFQSYGRSSSGSARNDLDLLIRYCGMVIPDWRGECIYGAVRDIVSNDASGDRALAYCNAVSPVYAGRCFYGLGTIIHDLDGLGWCDRVPVEYRPNCRLRDTA